MWVNGDPTVNGPCAKDVVIRNAQRILAVVAIVAITCVSLTGQTPATAVPQVAPTSLLESMDALKEQTDEMNAILRDLKAELLESRSEIRELRRQLELTRQQLPAGVAQPQRVSDDTGDPAIRNLEEEHELLRAKVEEQYQTKVESASKYRVRLSGVVLVNLFSNRGAVDNLDFPNFVLSNRPLYPKGSFAASVRQSVFGLEVFGPEVKGARVSADAQFDFAGGFPEAPHGVAFPLPRLRTAVVRLTSPRTTVVAGQDVPFFSPLSPSSIASVGVPAFSYAGNLWGWIPQARVDRRFTLAGNSNVLVQGGILDPLSGDPPYSAFSRTPQPGEASRQPAYAARVAWNGHVLGRDMSVGGGGYYSRQVWGFNREVDAWAGTSDWTVPVPGRFELSGEFYYGRAIGGLGGALGRSVLLSGPISDRLTQVKGVRSSGGWTQIKFRQSEKLEWNAAFGLDNVAARDLRLFPIVQQNYYDPSVARNSSSLVNFIYRPRSDLLWSLEYHRFRTFRIGGDSAKADQLNMSLGVLF